MITGSRDLIWSGVLKIHILSFKLRSEWYVTFTYLSSFSFLRENSLHLSVDTRPPLSLFPLCFSQIKHLLGLYLSVWGWPHLPYPRLNLISVGFSTCFLFLLIFTKHHLSETYQDSYSLKKVSVVANVLTIFSLR